MLGLSAYRLDVRRTEEAVFYELSEPGTGRLVGVARFDVAKPRPPGRLLTLQRKLFDSPTHRWLGVLLAVVMLPFGVLGVMLGLIPTAPQEGKPRLALKRPEGDEVVLTVRQSSGMFYDSRVVHDGEGRAIAQLRGPSKIPLGELSFGLIDLGGPGAQARDYGDLPWLGRVEPAGAGVYRLALVLDPDAGRVVEHSTRARYDIVAGPRLRDDPTGMRLLLATALALAWKAPSG